MRDSSIPTQVLLNETLRTFAQFLVLIAVLALACAALYFFSHSSRLLAVVVSSFFTLLYFSAPLAASSLRARRAVGLLTPSGRASMLFCFAWGGMAASAFVGTLQLWQGMEATPLNYVATFAITGAICAVAAAIPNRWFAV